MLEDLIKKACSKKFKVTVNLYNQDNGAYTSIPIDYDKGELTEPEFIQRKFDFAMQGQRWTRIETPEVNTSKERT